MVTAAGYVCAELAESSGVALELLERLDTSGWSTEDVRTLEAIIGRLRRAHRAFTS